MQLKAGGIAARLGVLSGALLGSSPASAQAEAASANAYDRSASEVGALIADTALLVYQEDDNRVRAVETASSLTWNAPSGMVVSGKFTYDSLTGATPNGSIRSRYPQTFYPPRSVTVAARTCVQATTLSTMAMLLGPAAETFLKGEKAEAWVLW